VADELDGRGVEVWLRAFAASFRAQRAELDDLDRRSGDGDFGTNLLAAIERGDADVAGAGAGAAQSAPGDAFAALAASFMGAGGTSGPLFGVWFRAFGRAATAAGRLDAAALATGAERGLDAVVKLGGAEPGDKTMVDAMAPAAAALADAAGDGLLQALAAAAAAAREGAEATVGLVARRGRASYVGEVARGVRDPGAVAVALFFEAGRDTTAASAAAAAAVTEGGDDHV
jgi:dihydroxyacetone kinase phosphoprotein-dependent L subunit